MSIKFTGGPAVPRPLDQDYFPGLTIRDYFAAAWMQGWMANPESGDATYEEAAHHAYRMADAMLKERAK